MARQTWFAKMTDADINAIAPGFEHSAD